jgi:hypothetical protein
LKVSSHYWHLLFQEFVALLLFDDLFLNSTNNNPKKKKRKRKGRQSEKGTKKGLDS